VFQIIVVDGSGAEKKVVGGATWREKMQNM